MPSSGSTHRSVAATAELRAPMPTPLPRCRPRAPRPRALSTAGLSGEHPGEEPLGAFLAQVEQPERDADETAQGDGESPDSRVAGCDGGGRHEEGDRERERGG